MTARWPRLARRSKSYRPNVIEASPEDCIGPSLSLTALGRCDGEVERLAQRMAPAPVNQLMMQKLMINQALENMGLRSTRMMATIFDGVTCHSPEGMAFKRRAE